MDESTQTWESIYSNYSKLNSRTALLNSNGISIPKKQAIDYTMEIEEARSQLCLDYANQLETKLEIKTRKNYKDAYYIIEKLKGKRCIEDGLDSLQQTCIEKGKANVVAFLTNQNGVNIPEYVEKKMAIFPFENNNKLGPWVRFLNDPQPTDDIHYSIEILYNELKISRNKKSSSSEKVETSVVEKYVYKTNSEGKKVKTPVYVKVKATVTTYYLQKEVSQGALITIVDQENKRVIFQRQIVGTASFYYEYGTYKGDSRALGKDHKKLVARKPKAFPSASTMIRQSGNQLYNKTKSIIKGQKRLYN
jgi:hypothetical protein